VRQRHSQRRITLQCGTPWTPPRLLQQLCQAFDLQILYKKNMRQVSINITGNTPHALAAILAAAGIQPTTSTADATEPDTSQPHFSDLAQALYALNQSN
jgi:hypothetical protein